MRIDVEIRPGRPDDDLAALWRGVYGVQHAPLLPPGVGIPFLPRGTPFIATVGDTMAGFCCVEENWLTELWVAVGHQRCGVGTALLKRAEVFIQMRGAREAVLTVLAINAPAIAFYECHGWQREPGTLSSVTGQPFYRFRKPL